MNILARLFANKNDNDNPLPGPKSYGLPKPPCDPHDARGRKWFRRTLVVLCIAGFAFILRPVGCMDGKEVRQSVRGMQQMEVMSDRCSFVTVTGFQNGPVTWYDCTKTFSDGSLFRRLGDAKP